MKKSDFEFNRDERPLYIIAGVLAAMIIVFASAFHIGHERGKNEAFDRAEKHLESLETEQPVFNEFYDYLESKGTI